MKGRHFGAALVAAALTLSGVAAASAAERNAAPLVRAVTLDGIMRHLKAFQRIADRHGGNRSVGTFGYFASFRYVSLALAKAGYQVQTQPFSVRIFEVLSTPHLVRLTAGRHAYKADKDFAPLYYSGAGEVTAELALAAGIRMPPPKTSRSTSGCSARDFPPRVRGKIVLVQRGGCDFRDKAEHAAKAGAVGVIIFNEGQVGRRDLVSGSLGQPQTIPVVGATYNIGRRLYDLVRASKKVRLKLTVDARSRRVETWNAIAELPGPHDARAIVVGAHLDSVPEGPGINDNGSGAATILEIAIQMREIGFVPRNTVRFAFWGAEEEGLYGSTHYVDHLGPRERRRIMANLNFDMLGSPNFVRYVYDGDGTIGPKGPAGSAEIEQIFDHYFADRNLVTEPADLDGQTDYVPFMEAGIPVGGLFSGASEKKTRAEARIFGGKASEPLDPCYHHPCDDLSNISRKSLVQLGKGAAHAVGTLAILKHDIRPADEAAAEAAEAAGAAAAAELEYRGPMLVR